MSARAATSRARPRAAPARDRSASWRARPTASALGAAAGPPGILLCLIAAAIVLYMLVRGHPVPAAPTCSSATRCRTSTRARRGGFLDPLIGTFLLTVIGTADRAAARRRDRGLADRVRRARRGSRARSSRASRSSPARRASCSRSSACSSSSSSSSASSRSRPRADAVFGRSFFDGRGDDVADRAAAVVGATREALQAIPRHVREASYALGKTKAATIRRVLLPAARPGIATGTALGMGRIAGDTAIVVILLGATLQLQGVGGAADARHAARHRQHADQLRLQQLAGGRGQRARQGLRGRLRAAADRDRAQLRRRPDRVAEREAGMERADRRRRSGGSCSTREPTVVAPPRRRRRTARRPRLGRRRGAARRRRAAAAAQRAHARRGR